ncbi:OsmC family protein [Methylophilus sp. 'Pure River']|uniref:OsmC family protein n=1 Tax=Methylophilus sp. 'Pure River' TaxID=3377117 RepID=UPI00398E7CCC
MSQESVKQALGSLIENIKTNPAASRVVFRASTKLEEDVRCSATVRNFPPLTIDEPPDLGGGDQGMNPVELVLVALGTCQEIMYSAYSAVMGIKLDECKVEVKGYLDLRGLLSIDPAISAGYQQISYTTTLRSSADPKAIEQLIEVVEGHCPVMDILARAQKVTGQTTLNGNPIHSLALNQ